VLKAVGFLILRLLAAFLSIGYAQRNSVSNLLGATVAWGQESSDAADDRAPEASDAAAAPDRSSRPPDIAGALCGSINDNNLGEGTINLSIVQKGRFFSGNWADSLGGSGTLKGRIVRDSVTLMLRQRGSRCGLAAVGTLVDSQEISGSFSTFGCRPSDGGTFDITSPTCD